MVDLTKTNIGAPDLSAASFVAPAVTDTSGAMRGQNIANAIGAIGKIGTDIYKAQQIADINKVTQSDIQDYMNARENPEIAKTALTDSFSTDVQTNVFQPKGEQLSGIEAAQRQRYEKYQLALKEGVITPDEFNDRVLTNLREAANRNPGLFPELKAEAARVLELSGITGVLKSDKLIAETKEKQAENLLKDMQERAKREHIYYDATTSYWQLAEQVKKAEEDTRAYDMQVRGKEKFGMLSQEQARSWTQETGNSVVRGSIANANNALLDIINVNGVTTESYPKFKAVFDSNLDNIHQVFVDSIPVNIRQDPLVQENIKAHFDGMERIKTRLANLGSGEDLKKVLNNEVEILKLGQDKTVRQTVNVSNLELAIKLAASTPGVITESPEFRKKIFDASVALSSGMTDSPAIDKVVPKSDRDNSSGALVEGSIASSIESGDFTPFKRTLEALNNKTATIQNPKIRLQFLHNNMTAIAKQKPMQLDASGIEKVETSIGQLLNDKEFGLGTLAQTNIEGKVQMDVLPSGHFMFIGQEASKFNATYANNVNLALRAYANAHNTTVTAASKRFYHLYFGPLIQSNGGK